MRTKAKNSGERRTEFIQMKVMPSLKEKAQKRAEQEGRSLSNYIEWLILQDLKKHQ